MSRYKLLLSGLVIAFAAAQSDPVRAADHDYYVHFGGTDWNEAGDITIADQYDLPMPPKDGACGMRFTGAEHYGWANEYTQHLGLEPTGGDVIQVRLQDRPGCSGSGIEIEVGNDVIDLPNFDIESFFVNQASSAKWINNSNQVIAPPACGLACTAGSSFKALQRAPEWQTAVFALLDVSPSGQRNGGAVRDRDSRVRSLLTVDVPAQLARLSTLTRNAVEARRGTLRADDDFIRDREDTALAALAGASSAAQQCVANASQISGNAAIACEKAARLARRAQTAVDVLAESL